MSPECQFPNDVVFSAVGGSRKLPGKQPLDQRHDGPQHRRMWPSTKGNAKKLSF